MPSAMQQCGRVQGYCAPVWHKVQFLREISRVTPPPRLPAGSLSVQNAHERRDATSERGAVIASKGIAVLPSRVGDEGTWCKSRCPFCIPLTYGDFAGHDLLHMCLFSSLLPSSSHIYLSVLPYRKPSCHSLFHFILFYEIVVGSWRQKRAVVDRG